ncbi:MAG: hypothetical protein LLG04_01990 [Parachlamydia sp.]|nr:hypothetical protein [Parachlamydia sp.]
MASNSRFKPQLWYLLLLIPLLFFIGMHEDATPAKLVDLPEKSPDFTGRKQELAMIEKRLLDKQEGKRSQLLAIYGEGGVGKTELAIAFANDHLNHCSLIGWISGNSEESLDHSYARLGDTLDIHEEHPIRRREKIHQALENGQGKKPWLLIFDDMCELPFELPKMGGAILITCRDKSLFPSHVTLELTKNPKDGLLLLSKLTGEPSSDALIHLTQQLDDLPLMINLAGHYIRATPGLNVSNYSKLLSELIETEDSPLKWQEFGKRYSKSLMASYRTTLELLQKKHPLSFEFLNQAALLHNNNIPNEFLVAWLETKNQFTPAQIDLLRGDILRELINHSLIRYDEKNKEFSLHQLLYHALAINRVDSNIWVKILSENGRMKAYNPTHIESIRPFQRVLPHVLKILDQTQQPNVPIVRLSLNVARYFIETEFQFQKGKIYLDRAEEWSEMFDHPIKGRIAFLQGMVLFREGEFHQEQAEKERLYLEALGQFEKALKIFQTEDRDDLYLAIEQNPAKSNKEYQRAICKQFQGQILRVLGRLDTAEDKLNEAMQDFQAIAQGGDHFDIARIMREQALISWEKGHEEEAIHLLENAILMQKRVYGEMYHSQPTAASTLRTLGDLYFQYGQFLKAKQAYQLAIDISRPIFQSDEHPFILELYRKQAKADQALSF